MIEERCTSWFRKSSESYTPQRDNEFEGKPTDDILRLSSPWADNAKVPVIAAGGLEDVMTMPKYQRLPDVCRFIEYYSPDDRSTEA
jgi:hypothetical protein